MDINIGTYTQIAYQILDICGTANSLAVKTQNDIACFKPGIFRCGAFQNLLHDSALVRPDAKLLGNIRIHILDFYPQLPTLHPAILHDLGNDSGSRIDRHCKTNTQVTTALVSQYGSIDANQFTTQDSLVESVQMLR